MFDTPEVWRKTILLETGVIVENLFTASFDTKNLIIMSYRYCNGAQQRDQCRSMPRFIYIHFNSSDTKTPRDWSSYLVVFLYRLSIEKMQNVCKFRLLMVHLHNDRLKTSHYCGSVWMILMTFRPCSLVFFVFSEIASQKKSNQFSWKRHEYTVPSLINWSYIQS